MILLQEQGGRVGVGGQGLKRGDSHDSISKTTAQRLKRKRLVILLQEQGVGVGVGGQGLKRGDSHDSISKTTAQWLKRKRLVILLQEQGVRGRGRRSGLQAR